MPDNQSVDSCLVSQTEQESTQCVSANEPHVAIGLVNPKTPVNVGGIMRASGCYGVNQVFYTGRRYDLAVKADTQYEVDKKQALFQIIESISNPYYQSRAYCQLSRFQSMSKSIELLDKAYIAAEKIDQFTLKFQVLELIYQRLIYLPYNKTMIEKVLFDLENLFTKIIGHYDRVVAAIKLFFLNLFLYEIYKYQKIILIMTL